MSLRLKDAFCKVLNVVSGARLLPKECPLIRGDVIAPFVAAPGNHSEAPLLRAALPNVMRIARSVGLELQRTIVSLDGGYDCRQNRKAIFNRGMVPNINANPRGRKSAKRGRKPLFNADIFKERFNTIERVFGWEDKFRRLLLRFKRLTQLHYEFGTLAYTMINLYQPTHELTVLAYSRVAIERMRSGAAMSLFQASQQASTMVSYVAKVRLLRSFCRRYSQMFSTGLSSGE